VIKKWNIVFVIILLSMVISACEENKEVKNYTYDSVNRSTKMTLPNEKKHENDNTIKDAIPKNDVIPKEDSTLSNEEAELLRDQAFHHFYVVTMGGGENGKPESADKKEYYFYYSENLNNREKLSSYLNEVFTSEVTSEIMMSLSLKIINGRLAFQPLEWGSMRDWGQAKVKVNEDRGDVKILAFTFFDDGEGKQEKKYVEFHKVKNWGWRIASMPENIT
jgi:hypothetical protein